MMQSDPERCVVRIAPSPTGALHIGTARTALFNYLYAKQQGGTFILRLEDTDRERSEERYVREIEESLTWLGIEVDEVAKQSERKDIYTRYIQQLIEGGYAYPSEEPAKDDPSVMTTVIRFRNTKPQVTFHDTLRGEITMDISDLGDFVIARSEDDPLYNLAVVIDDMDMGVTHTIRGDDHIANTPRQIVLLEALGASRPSYTHIPLIHSPSGGKLSKRKDATSILKFKEDGYLPQAMVNFMALLGWAPKDEQEVFSLDELVQAFSLERIQKREAVFNEKKLRWFQKQHFHRLPTEEVERMLSAVLSKASPEVIRLIAHQVQEAGLPFKEVADAVADGAYDYFLTSPQPDASLLFPPKLADASVDQVKTVLLDVQQQLKGVSGWSCDAVRSALNTYAEGKEKALVFWPVRVALSGKGRSMDPALIAEGIGKEETLSRIERAVHTVTTSTNI